MSPQTPVSEADLHAYADGQLHGPRRAAVEAFLAADAEAAAKVEAWRQQAAVLHARLDGVRILAESGDDRLLLGPENMDRGGAEPAKHEQPCNRRNPAAAVRPPGQVGKPAATAARSRRRNAP